MDAWASSFGVSLFETGRQATKFETIYKKFQTEGAELVEVDGSAMVKQMAENVENMVEVKINAIKVKKFCPRIHEFCPEERILK